jgi:hypothetical protein
MSINWGTVATAVVLTLILEYFFKPFLEARKQRHLENLRTRQELLAALVSLTMSAKIYVTEVPDDIDPVLRQAFKDERARHYGRLKSTVSDLFDNAGRYAKVYPALLSDDLIAYLACLHGVMLSRRPKHRQADIIQAMGVPAATVLDPRPWRLIGCMRARDELMRLIAQTERQSDDTEAAA